MAHHDLGMRIIFVDRVDVDRTPRIAPEGIVKAPAEARTVVTPAHAPIPPRAGTEGITDVGPRLAVGVAIDQFEPVISVLHGEFRRAIEQVAFDRIARGDRIAGEADHETIGLDPLLAEALAVEAMAGRGMIGRRALAAGERQRGGRDGGEQQRAAVGRKYRHYTLHGRKARTMRFRLT